MSALGRMHKATVVVPLALLSAAWTASLAGVGATSASADDPSTVLPDGTSVPSQAVEAPASVSTPGVVAPGVPAGSASEAVSTATTAGIPEAALLAYQRAESVINSADKSCNVPWQLIAAIGRVESDHGRYGGNALSADGVAEPGIYGIALDGTRNTQTITDTDAGQYDNDTKYDRAVGPMQFIPSTWSVVGVDGDNDGRRNPQDIDDASLATAVYLCSGEGDLSQEKDQRASVYRYNHSNDYVDLVLSIMQAYMDGEFSAVPTSTTSSGVLIPNPAAVSFGDKGKAKDRGKDKAKPQGTKGGGDKGNQTTTATPTPTPTATATPEVPTPTETPTKVPTKLPTLPTPTLPSVTLPTPTAPVLEPTLTWAQAQTQCLASGISALDLAALNACINDLMTP